MAENLSEEARALARLVSFSRNKYFYGKMLTERELTLEQCYMNRKRWLINRLGLGSGVLCGLEVELSEDGTRLLVHPGVAIDPLGREIIVPEAYCLADLRQPTDCQGNPSGDQIRGAATLYLCLCYHECNAEPVPVLVSDCDTRQGCAANLVLHLAGNFSLAENAPDYPQVANVNFKVFQSQFLQTVSSQGYYLSLGIWRLPPN